MKLIEILIVLSIVVIASVWAWTGLSSYNKYQSLMQVSETVLSVLETARYNTLESRGGSTYGVHVEDHAVTMFRGNVYSAEDSENVRHTIDDSVTLVPTFFGGGVDVVFKKLSGATEQYGTIQLTQATGATRTIAISAAGAISFYK